MQHGIASSIAIGIGAGITAEAGRFGERDEYDKAGHYAFGIEQLRGSRQRALFSRFGANPTHEQEMQFLLDDLMGRGDPGGPAVLRAGDAAAAASAYVLSLMRPGTGTLGDLHRAQLALAGGRTSHRTTHVHVAAVHVHTRATDAKGIARDVGPALVTQAQRGLV
jgi:hypothetical protein